MEVVIRGASSLLLNTRGEHEELGRVSVNLVELGCARPCAVRDLWRKKNIGEFAGGVRNGSPSAWRGSLPVNTKETVISPASSV
jgi:hypothetical protein